MSQDKLAALQAAVKPAQAAHIAHWARSQVASELAVMKRMSNGPAFDTAYQRERKWACVLAVFDLLADAQADEEGAAQ